MRGERSGGSEVRGGQGLTGSPVCLLAQCRSILALTLTQVGNHRRLLSRVKSITLTVVLGKDFGAVKEGAGSWLRRPQSHARLKMLQQWSRVVAMKVVGCGLDSGYVLKAEPTGFPEYRGRWEESKESRMTPAESNLNHSLSNLPDLLISYLQLMNVTNHGEVQPKYRVHMQTRNLILRALHVPSTTSPYLKYFPWLPFKNKVIFHSLWELTQVGPKWWSFCPLQQCHCPLSFCDVIFLCLLLWTWWRNPSLVDGLSICTWDILTPIFLMHHPNCLVVTDCHLPTGVRYSSALHQEQNYSLYL